MTWYVTGEDGRPTRVEDLADGWLLRACKGYKGKGLSALLDEADKRGLDYLAPGIDPMQVEMKWDDPEERALLARLEAAHKAKAIHAGGLDFADLGYRVDWTLDGVPAMAAQRGTVTLDEVCTATGLSEGEVRDLHEAGWQGGTLISAAKGLRSMGKTTEQIAQAIKDVAQKKGVRFSLLRTGDLAKAFKVETRRMSQVGTSSAMAAASMNTFAQAIAQSPPPRILDPTGLKMNVETIITAWSTASKASVTHLAWVNHGDGTTTLKLEVRLSA